MEKKRRLELIVAASCLIAGLLGCENREPPTQPVIRPVRTEQVFSTGGTRVRTFSGTAQAGFQSRLSFRVPGKVRRVEVKVGDPVKPGQLIAELDPEDYRLQVQEIKASLERARAESRNAEANYSRIRALYENRNASRNELDSARAASESAGAQALSLEKRLELVRAQLRYTRLEASTEGTIATVDVEINENVQAGQPVVLLTAGSRPEVVVGVPEILISQVHPASQVTVSFDAVPHRAFSAVVTEVGVVTGMSVTYPVIVRLVQDDPDIRPGMAAEVAFPFPSTEEKEFYLVPPVAVGEDRQGRYVFIAEPREGGLATVRRHPVTVGELREGGIEVLHGLSDGDLVVIAGVSRIADGEVVKLLPQPGDGQP